MKVLSFFIFLLFFLLTLSATGFSAQISLAWSPNTESNLGGYRLYYGTSSGNYSQTISVGLSTNYTVTNLTEGETYYFALTAVSAEGLDFSSLDGEKVQLLFLIISPPDRPGDHLRALENISRQLRNDSFCRFLKNAKSVDEIQQLLNEADNSQFEN